MSTDIPNTFIQTDMVYRKDKESIIMKVKGVLVDILLKKNPAQYGGHVVYESGKKVMYV